MQVMYMSKCEIRNCKFETWKKETKCVLHCNKSNELEENNLELFSSFYDILLEYVANQVDFSKKSIHTLSGRDNFIQHIKSDEDSDEKDDTSIKINKVIFPNARRKDSYYYFKILKKFSKIFFVDCEFFGKEMAGNIESSLKLFYDTCLFHNEWFIRSENNDVKGGTYYKCVFEDDVKYAPLLNAGEEINYSLFHNCEFKKKIEFVNVVFNAPIFSNSGDFKGKIGAIEFVGCKIASDSKFVLNNHRIDKFVLKDTKIEAKFEFKQNEIGEFYIHNTNFGKDLVVDMYETKFAKFNIEKSIFEGFVGFEKCIFSTKNYDKGDQITQFTYATFLSFVNFRNAKFYGGLDLENTNLKESPNFLNVEVNDKFSNRETFRIIKNAFDKTGNNIEGNKFFSFEMKKYREELESTNQTQEKIILLLNEKISNFGRDYIVPVIWIVVVAIFHNVVIYGHEHTWLYGIHPTLDYLLSLIASLLNGFAVSILPFSKILNVEDTKGIEFLSLLFYAAYASLIWQTLVALKRHTKR
jgi:hypothetical protein